MQIILKLLSISKKNRKKKGSNQVLFMLDYATALFAAGRFEEAIKVFLKTEDLCAIKDYTSISEEVGALSINENVKSYLGEDYEKVLINVYLSLAFAALGNYEGAQVEARKINLILNKFINEGKKKYEESPFARYLSAMLWEASGELNSAYVDYKLTHQLDPRFPGLGEDLIGIAKRMSMNDEVIRWQSLYPNQKPRQFAKNEGELIVVFEQGLSPIKKERDDHQNLPRYTRRFSDVHGVQIRLGDKVLAKAFKAMDIESTSIRYLDDRISKLIARRMLGTAVKGAIAYGVGQKSKDSDLGVLTFYALMAMDRADLRSWRSLPASFMLARVKLPAGIHHLTLDRLSLGGQPRSSIELGPIEIKAGKKVFIVRR